ncbi:MAG: hypothetical protein IKA76_02895 [Clostridia bacterium]|nr:hypothetical protein [Clostridia bacterium]
MSTKTHIEIANDCRSLCKLLSNDINRLMIKFPISIQNGLWDVSFHVSDDLSESMEHFTFDLISYTDRFDPYIEQLSLWMQAQECASILCACDQMLLEYKNFRGKIANYLELYHSLRSNLQQNLVSIYHSIRELVVKNEYFNNRIREIFALE